MKTKTHRTVSTLLALLMMIVSAAAPPAAATTPIAAPIEIAPPEEVPDISDIDITKLRISPQHTGMDLMPGESDKITITVKPPNNKTVSVNPTIKDQPYSEYIFKEKWITITHGSAELKADAGTPTARRILPETTAEFYAEKTCLSGTWADASVSALVDMKTGSVVKTWGGGG
ncbi:MAG: hypothetical protein EF813_10415 [Methanosarcinales archaeon]|nr:MAG: hypothetical protein EF813_10415 [Methanosarcinales archaeon]